MRPCLHQIYPPFRGSDPSQFSCGSGPNYIMLEILGWILLSILLDQTKDPLNPAPCLPTATNHISLVTQHQQDQPGQKLLKVELFQQKVSAGDTSCVGICKQIWNSLAGSQQCPEASNALEKVNVLLLRLMNNVHLVFQIHHWMGVVYDHLDETHSLFQLEQLCFSGTSKFPFCNIPLFCFYPCLYFCLLRTTFYVSDEGDSGTWKYIHQ